MATIGFVILVIGLMVEILSESFSNAEQTAQKQADDLKISQLNELAKQEQLEIARANLEAQRIRGLVTWRDLTRTQCEQIISSVPATGTVRIEYPSGDPEALLLSIKLENCFGQMSRWRILSSAMMLQDALPFGLNVSGEPGPLMDSVKGGLLAAGFQFSARDPEEIERHVTLRTAANGKEDVKIIVGSRPIFDAAHSDDPK